MIYLETDLEEFKKSHRIQEIEVACSTCGLVQKTTIPVVTAKSFGLVTAKHVCENPIEGYTFVAKDKYKHILNSAQQLFKDN